MGVNSAFIEKLETGGYDMSENNNEILYHKITKQEDIDKLVEVISKPYNNIITYNKRVVDTVKECVPETHGMNEVFKTHKIPDDVIKVMKPTLDYVGKYEKAVNNQIESIFKEFDVENIKRIDIHVHDPQDVQRVIGENLENATPYTKGISIELHIKLRDD